jgi:hypothetical protein
VNIPGHEADARLARLGHLLQLLYKEAALVQVRIGVPMIHYVVQQVRVVKPAQGKPEFSAQPARGQSQGAQ